MTDELTRRDFLKTAGFAVIGIAGAATIHAQDQEKPKPSEPKDPDDDEDLFGSDDASGGKGDDDEEETRACPQCGALMYREGNTWICETCGYSYVE